MPHLAAEPRIGRRGGRPDPLVQPCQHNQLRALNAGLQRAPDRDIRMRFFTAPHRSRPQQLVEQVAILRPCAGAAVVNLCLKPCNDLARLNPRRLKPKLAGLDCAFRPCGKEIAERQMLREPIGQQLCVLRNSRLEHLFQPPRPHAALRVFMPIRPSEQRFRRRKGRTIAPQVQIQLAGEQHMQPAPALNAFATLRACCRQRMFEQDQQGFDRHRLGHRPRGMAQEPPRRGELQRLARAIIGHDPPTPQSRCDPPCQHPIRRDQRRAHALLCRLAQHQRHGHCLAPDIGRFDQGDIPHRLDQIGQELALVDPLIGHRRRPQC